MYMWHSRDRLCNPRMVWDEDGRNWNEPKYELVKWERPGLRKCSMLPAAFTRVEDDQFWRRRLPGKIGNWPHTRKAKKKKWQRLKKAC
jgi:hypothetical protein